MKTFSWKTEQQLNLPTQRQLLALWNQAYPINLVYQSLADFQQYLQSLENVKHILFVDNEEQVKAWAFTFDREKERWFGIILAEEIQGLGYGRKMMMLLQEAENELNGWVTDHNEYVKANGEVYRSPLGFYKKCGFSVLAEQRLELPQLSAVKIRWTKMDKYQETYETWNKVAALYQAKFMELDFYNESYDFICNAISKPHAKLLEMGCGPGNITKYLLSKRPDFDIFATDIAPNMIELAKINNPSARFEVMDSREIDQINEKFGGVICGFCLPYLSHSDCEKMIVDVANLLYDEGILYLSFVEGEPEKSGYQVGSSGDRTYFYFHKIETITQQLTKNKLALVKVFHIEYPKSQGEMEIHTVILAKKLC